MSIQEQLQEKLLAQAITPDDFLSELLRLDQLDPEHPAAYDNLKILDNSEVEEVFANANLQSRYYKILSITHFHIAQIEVKKDNALALEHFKAAADAAQKVQGESPVSWGLYTKATVAYLKSDRETLEKILPDMKEGANKNVVVNFIKGLKEHGAPDYYKDYSSQIRT